MATSVTEAVRQEASPNLDQAKRAELERDPALAQQLGRQLLKRAKELAPNIDWSLETLRDALVVATDGKNSEGPLVEGRHLRKRIRELAARAERYRENFSISVIHLREANEDRSNALAKEILVTVRKSDWVCAYRSRIILLQPFMTESVAENLMRRTSAAVSEASRHLIHDFACAEYPSTSLCDTQAALDWVEDQLR